VSGDGIIIIHLVDKVSHSERNIVCINRVQTYVKDSFVKLPEKSYSYGEHLWIQHTLFWQNQVWNKVSKRHKG